MAATQLEYYPHFHGELGTDHHLRANYFTDEAYRGCVVEVGGGTPVCHSLSRHWICNGWRGIIIEPNPHFVALHRAIGNEVFECACSDHDEGDADFYVVGPPRDSVPDGILTEHATSSLGPRPSHLAWHQVRSIDQLEHTKIRVKVRTLDSVLQEAGNPTIDILSVDTEGWELEVMRGFDLARHRPAFVILENFAYDPAYTEYMEERGYKARIQLAYNYIFAPAP